MIKENEVMKWLFEVEHPAKAEKNIVELGMVEKVEVEDGKVTVTLGFSKHRDPLAEYLIGSTKASVIRNAPSGTEVQVKTVIRNEAAPKKKPGLDLGMEELENVKHITAILTATVDFPTPPFPDAMPMMCFTFSLVSCPMSECVIASHEL